MISSSPFLHELPFIHLSSFSYAVIVPCTLVSHLSLSLVWLRQSLQTGFLLIGNGIKDGRESFLPRK